MKDFKKPGGRRDSSDGRGFRGARSGGGGFSRPSFGAKPGYPPRGGGKFGAPQLHSAVCSKCGKPCEVPFRPDGHKPVYCRDCFGAPKSGAPAGGFVNRDRASDSFRPAPETGAGLNRVAEVEKKLDLIHDKLDKILQVLVASRQATMPAANIKERPAASQATLGEIVRRAEAKGKKALSKKKAGKK